MTQKIKIIGNGELYTKYLLAHQFALSEFERTEERYLGVIAWEVIDEEPVTTIVKPIYADWYSKKQEK